MKLITVILAFILPATSLGFSKMAGAIAKYDCSSCEGKNELIFYKDLSYRSSVSQDNISFIINTGKYTFCSDTLILSPEWCNKQTKLSELRFILRNDTLRQLEINNDGTDAVYYESPVNTFEEANSKINRQNILKRHTGKLHRVMLALTNVDSIYTGHAFQITTAYGHTMGEISEFIGHTSLMEMEGTYYYQRLIFMMFIRSQSGNFNKSLPDYPQMLTPSSFNSMTYELALGYNLFRLPNRFEMNIYGGIGRTSYTHESVGWHHTNGNLTSTSVATRLTYNLFYDKNHYQHMMIPISLKVGYNNPGFESAYKIGGGNLFFGLAVGFKFDGFKRKYVMPK